MNWQKIIITGADGMVGSYVNFGIRTDRNTLDICDEKAVNSFFDKYRPEAVLHLAAETDVDLCQKNPSHGYRINVFGTYNIANAAQRLNSKMIYISSTSVFDGKRKLYSETDRPNPQNIYGRTKYLGEIIVKDIVPNYLIIRAGWMFGGGPKKDKKFTAKIIKQSNSDEIKAIRDVRGSPIFAKDLITETKKLIAQDKTGLYHIVNSGTCSRYEFAKEIIRLKNLNVRIVPVNSNFFPENISRGNEMLNSRIKKIRNWKKSLKEYIDTEWK